jgi:hypothetical protein
LLVHPSTLLLLCEFFFEVIQKGHPRVYLLRVVGNKAVCGLPGGFKLLPGKIQLRVSDRFVHKGIIGCFNETPEVLNDVLLLDA